MLLYSHYIQFNTYINRIKTADGIKVVSQLALKLGDYCGLSR